MPKDKLTYKTVEPNPYEAPGEDDGHRPASELSELPELSKGGFDRESYVAARKRWNAKCWFIAAALFFYGIVVSLFSNILLGQFLGASDLLRSMIAWSVLLAIVAAILVALFGRIAWYFFHWWR